MSRTINRLHVCETSNFEGISTFEQNVVFDYVSGGGQITFDLSSPNQTTNALVDFPAFGDTTAHTFLFDDVNATVANKYFENPKMSSVYDANNNIVLNIFAPSGVSNNSTWQHLLMSGTTGSIVTIEAVGTASNIGIHIKPKGTGQVKIDDLTFPATDGTNGQVLQTDGAGNLVFATTTLPTEYLFTTTATTPTQYQIVQASAANTTYYLNVRAVGSTATNTDNNGGAYAMKAAFHRGTGAASLHKIGGPTCDDVLSFEDDTAYAINTIANTTSGNIEIAVTGDVTDEVDWKMHVQVLSIVGAV